MMFADLTHTPEALAVPGTDLHHPAFYENANDVLRTASSTRTRSTM